MENLHPHIAIRALQEFWLNDLSRGYIQIVRDRLALEDEEAKAVLTEVYVTLIKLTAPFMPFITEKIWQELKERRIVKEESVHLCEWPKTDSKKINEKLEKGFLNGMKIIEKGMAERDLAKIGLKWPLAGAIVETPEKIGDEIKKIIEKQLNIKKIEIKETDKSETSVKIDSKMTPELEAEGFSRELARKIQAERKNAGLKKGDLINLKIYCDLELKNMFETHLNFLKERTNSKKIDFLEGGSKKAAITKIKDKNIGIEID